MLKVMPAGDHKALVRNRLSVLDPAGYKPKDVIPAEFWKTTASVPLQSEEREKELAKFLADVACSDDSPPYIARGLFRHGRLIEIRWQMTNFADRLRIGKSNQLASTPCAETSITAPGARTSVIEGFGFVAIYLGALSTGGRLQQAGGALLAFARHLVAPLRAYS